MSAPEPRRRPTPRVTRVTGVDRISASTVRLVLTGDDLADFRPVFADAYVKVQFPDPAGGDPRQRTYTVRAFDPERRALTIDFVVHGDQGLAGPWAASASVGDECVVMGPGGGYSPSATADWHLLAGDESALPAIAAALEWMPPGAPVQVFVEVHGPADEVELPAADGAQVTWLHRGDDPVGLALVDAVREWPLPAGEGHLFVHGEAGAVKELRRYLRVERGLPMEQLSISGYWRLGADDEAWRRVKRDWNREVEESERVGGAA